MIGGCPSGFLVRMQFDDLFGLFGLSAIFGAVSATLCRRLFFWQTRGFSYLYFKEATRNWEKA